MIQLIIGEKGKGKTKILLEQANNEVKDINGNAVYLDKSKQHMFELSKHIRLIDVTDYPIDTTESFVGFLLGIISQDNDLEKIYLDSFLNLMKIDEQQAKTALDKIGEMSETYKVDFVISISVTRDQIPDERKDSIIHEC